MIAFIELYERWPGLKEPPLLSVSPSVNVLGTPTVYIT